MTLTNAPFAPKATSTKALSVGVSINLVEVNPGPGRCRRLRLHNAGPSLVFVELTGAGGDVSSATGMPIPVGHTGIYTAPGSYIAAVTQSGSATLYVTPGEGA